MFGGLHPLWTIPSSFLFGGLLVGANAMQRAIQIPSALIVALNGLIVVFVVSSTTVRDRLRQSLEVAGLARAQAEDTGPTETSEDDSAVTA